MKTNPVRGSTISHEPEIKETFEYSKTRLYDHGYNESLVTTLQVTTLE
jgi:hypothetical protein